MKTDLKTPLKIKGCGDVDSLFDAEGNYMADVTDLPFMLEVVRRVNAHDEIVEAASEYLDVLCDMTEPDGSVDQSAALRAIQIRKLLQVEKARTK